MDQSRIRDYLLSLSKDAEGRLGRLRKEAEASDVPIIKPDTEELLRTMVQLLKPESILEIGTAIGYSAMVMADCSEAGIVTIESYEKRIPMAKANFDEAGFTDRISLMEGYDPDMLGLMLPPCVLPLGTLGGGLRGLFCRGAQVILLKHCLF